MAVTCTPDNLANLSKCLTGLSETQLKAAQIYFLCSKLNGVTPSCSPDSIATAIQCYLQIPEGDMDAIIVYLLCQLVNS